MGTHQVAQRNKPATTEQQVLAYQLKLAGHSIRTIADRLDCSHTWAWQLIEREVEARKWPLAEKWRDMELGRLEDLWRILYTRIEDGTEDLLPLVDRLTKIAERRSKLLGLDAPTKVDATVHEVTQQDLEIQELIRDAEAKAKAAEQAIKNGAGQ